MSFSFTYRKEVKMEDNSQEKLFRELLDLLGASEATQPLIPVTSIDEPATSYPVLQTQRCLPCLSTLYHRDIERSTRDPT